MSHDPQNIVNRAQLLAAIPGLKRETLGYLLRNREHNGLNEAKAVFRPGKEFLFDVEKFAAFIRERTAV